MLAFSVLPVQAGSLNAPYTDSSYFTKLWFGAHSHWLQPWRAYLETVPAHRFLDGVGVGLPANHENPDLILEMLAKHGVRNGRIEIGWSSINWDESGLNNLSDLQAVLLACKRWNVRPLILLNAHQGAPGPVHFFNRTVTANAAAGASQVRLDDASNLVIGKSGLSNLTDYWAAEAIVTAINGNLVTLSKPLPNAIAANTRVQMATLKYRPFSVPGSRDYNKTVAAWQRYVGLVAAFVTEALGTGASRDKGFDMEIWNEMSFGSNFLNINAYYQPAAYAYNVDSIWGNLVQATMDYVAANPAAFENVQFNDGFGNTLPWQAASSEPARIRAIGKHPYAGRKNFPNDEYGGARLNALGQEDGYVPTYSEVFPEYFATALQTETAVRDMGPITSNVYGALHGRNARPDHPTPIWITEVGFAPNENGITDEARALALKAKTTGRYYSFYLNKGAEKVQLYSADAGDLWLGVVQDNFVDYARTSSVYPVNDASFVSPALQVIGNITGQMRKGLDPNLTETRQLSVDSISDAHDHYQFLGDGTTAHPPLYNRDVFAFLPYQVNAHRFVIPYYVMTRDVTTDLAPEQYTIEVSGLKGNNAIVTAYDPVNNQSVPLTINHRTDDSLNLTLTATDYPYLLTVEENSNGRRNNAGWLGEYFDNPNFNDLAIALH